MKNRANRFTKIAVGMLAGSLIFLTGCGSAKVPEEVTVNSIVVSAKGAVTSYLVDVFDKEYYDVSDLTSMAVDEAAAYNTEHQQGETVPVTVEKVEETGQSGVRLIHQYDSTSSFEEFNDAVLYFGLAEDAGRAGHDLNGTEFINVKDGTSVSADSLGEELSGNHILITDAKAVIYCPYQVTYVGGNAVYQEDGSVDALQNDGKVIVLMKK